MGRELLPMLTLAGPVILAEIGPCRCSAPFTDDPQLLSIGARLLSIAAAFQLFDGTQAVAIGVLRGVGRRWS
jgi:multidrug resistance protein, MATE family